MKYTFHVVDVFSSTRLTLEESIGPVTVDVTQRDGGCHGTLTLSGKIKAPTGAPSPTDLAAVLSIEPAS